VQKTVNERIHSKTQVVLVMFK